MLKISFQPTVKPNRCAEDELLLPYDRVLVLVPYNRGISLRLSSLLLQTMGLRAASSVYCSDLVQYRTKKTFMVFAGSPALQYSLYFPLWLKKFHGLFPTICIEGSI